MGGDAAKYLPIGDYAVIGDCRTAGLVSRDGSLDWLCFPRFDSPSIFAALLDTEQGGRFRIRPVGEFSSERRYLPDTNILETIFHCPEGTCVLRDLIPVASEVDQRGSLTPEHQVLREVEGVDGEVELEIVYDPRPDYGRLRPTLEQRGSLGLWCQAKRAILILRSELPIEPLGSEPGARGTGWVRAGDRKYLSLVYSGEAPAIIPLLGEAARWQVAQSADWWRAWASRCTYWGPFRQAVIRSILTLKLMTYAPSGAVIAAPTTSLPERLGGTRNRDYRYCWLRDASFTLRAFFTLGFDQEATAFLDWMLHATRLTWPELRILYDIYGNTRLPERELPYLAGYAGSRPVRVGNGATDQLQLDVYGEVIDAVALFARRGGRFDRETARLLAGLGQTVCRRWREPDDGIWEGRSGRSQLTHSKVLCWVALDRLIWMHEAGLLRVPVERFRAERAALRAAIETHGYNEEMRSYTRTFDSDDLDAGLLLLPLYGYLQATEPRMRSTYARIHERLARGPLLYRYEEGTSDGFPHGEGAFGICGFWAAECLARSGEVDAARRAFEQLLSYGNDVGLFAEEIDPDTGDALGNFPQAFTHVGLINAALTLAECSMENPPAWRYPSSTLSPSEASS